MTARPNVRGDPAAAFLERLSPGSRPTMNDALNWFARILKHDDPHVVPWHALRRSQTLALRDALAERCAPATANKMLAALRGVLKEAWRSGNMGAEEYQRAVDLPPVRGKLANRGRSLDRAEIGALFSACTGGDDCSHARDAAILTLAYGAGLRVSEITALNREDYDDATGIVHVRGKRHREREVHTTNGAKAALDAWVRIRGADSGSMFWAITRSGGLRRERRLTRSAINLMLRRRARQAGVVEFSPHDLRRSFIEELLDRGVDLARVQHLAGHANPQTTARYDRRGGEERETSSVLVRVPYRSPSIGD